MEKRIRVKTTVYLEEKIKKSLQHILFDRDISFSKWVESKMKEEVNKNK